jgi:hypothetical protein
MHQSSLARIISGLVRSVPFIIWPHHWLQFVQSFSIQADSHLSFTWSVDGCVSNPISDNSQGLATEIILDYSSMNLGFQYVYIDLLDFDILKFKY